MGQLKELIGRQLVESGRMRSQRQMRVHSHTSTYDCVSRNHARALVEQLLDLQDRTHHCARIVVEGCKVTLDTWTPNEGITELDEEFATEAGILFEDTRHWNR